LLETQQGTGTFISTNSDSTQKAGLDDGERQKRLVRIVGEWLARAGADGYTLDEVIALLQDMRAEQQGRRERQ
jgi:GntR family transcriptional regulator